MKKTERASKRTRSKMGCVNCKRRKKKCDEIKPICTGCLKRNIICEYKDPHPNQIEQSKPTTGLSEEAIRALGIENSTGDGMRDLKNVKISTIKGLKTIVGEQALGMIQKEGVGGEFFDLLFGDDPKFQQVFNSLPKSMEVKLPVELTFEELSHFEYYCKTILPNLCILPQEFNYYSKIYIPLAFKESAVLYTLVGWGCKMKKNHNLNFQVENKDADRYIDLANELIVKYTNSLDKEKFITNFVCYMILVCMEISFGDTSNWSHYFTSCFNMINKMPGDFRYLLNSCSVEGNLLAENFAYFDVLASQSNENGTFYPINDYKALFASNENTIKIHDPLQGCIRPIILIIGEIVNVLVEYNTMQVNLDLPECDRFEIMSRMMKRADQLDKEIKFTKPDLTCLPYFQTPEELEFQLTLFEVYQLATQIYLRQVIRKLPPMVPEIQILAYNLREDLRILVKSPRLKNSLAFPMLLLGITAVTTQDRKDVKDMFNILIQVCGYLSSYQKLLFVVQKIWSLNENGIIYIDWFKVTKQLGWRLNLGR